MSPSPFSSIASSLRTMARVLTAARAAIPEPAPPTVPNAATAAPDGIAATFTRARRDVERHATARFTGERPAAVYVASPFGEAKHAMAISDALVSAGYEVTSRWIAQALAGQAETSNVVIKRARLAENLADLDRADLVVVWTATGTPKCALIEIGWALALGIPVLWVQGITEQGGNLADAHGLVTVLRSTDLSRVVATAAALCPPRHRVVVAAGAAS